MFGLQKVRGLQEGESERECVYVCVRVLGQGPLPPQLVVPVHQPLYVGLVFVSVHCVREGGGGGGATKQRAGGRGRGGGGGAGGGGGGGKGGQRKHKH